MLKNQLNTNNLKTLSLVMREALLEENFNCSEEITFIKKIMKKYFAPTLQMSLYKKGFSSIH